MTKEEKAAYKKAWCLANKKKIAEQKKDYYLANKEKLNERAKAWYFANKEKIIINSEKRTAYKKTYLLKLNLANKKISKRTLSAWSLRVRTTQPKCMTCGSTEDLHAHHIAPKIEYPELALLLLNGITLCKDCHIKVHATPV
jgi:5-methylcytosine-specific restriction endonuclease McrA